MLIINKKTTAQTKGSATIRFNRKGNITINRNLCDLMGIKPHDTIALRINDEGRLQLYECKDGFKLRPHNTTLMLYSREAVSIVMDFLQIGEDVKSAGLYIQDSGRQEGGKIYYTIETAEYF